LNLICLPNEFNKQVTKDTCPTAPEPLNQINNFIYNIGVITASPPTDTPEVVDCRQGVAEIRNSKMQATQDLDRFGPQCA
jgi:hypothetical protein